MHKSIGGETLGWEGAGYQNALKIFRGKAERHLAEGSVAEILPSHVSRCRVVSWRKRHLFSFTGQC